ncbi:MAG TPA: hypothetical protein VND68_10320 [Chloroflexia bacterium]|nr:hypothetical protein [Chloroflexia bacterium]
MGWAVGSSSLPVVGWGVTVGVKAPSVAVSAAMVVTATVGVLVRGVAVPPGAVAEPPGRGGAVPVSTLPAVMV